MKEIGGYLELETLIHREYYPELLALNTARNAFVYLCKARNIQKVYLPYFLCDSLAGVCRREHIDYGYYPLGADFLPQFDRTLGAHEWLYVVNYYGQMRRDQMEALKSAYGNLIMDNVQAFFERPVPGVDTIYSCRKFFGVPDGAYLSTDAAELPLEADSSRERMAHLLGRYEGDSASAYYEAFQHNEERFDALPLRAMSRITHALLGAVDYDAVIRKRDANWACLHGALGARNRLQLIAPAGPYMYPLYIENGAQIRKALVKQKIYIPTLWPNVLDFDGCELEKDYAENILPLPVDQRYSEEDMRYLVEQILTCEESKL